MRCVRSDVTVLGAVLCYCMAVELVERVRDVTFDRKTGEWVTWEGLDVLRTCLRREEGRVGDSQF